MAEPTPHRDRLSGRYDPACAALAEHFLKTGADTVTMAEQAIRLRSMAIAIQRAVEDWYDAHDGPATDVDEGHPV